jgi:RNA polymerase sigma-70 factor (ECF subfamily)
VPQDDTRSDEELIDAANRGDRDALAALYLRHKDWCASVALRFTRDRELALDLVQHVFAAFFRRFPGFSLRSKLTTYLYPALRNAAATHRRAAQVRADAADKIALSQTAADPASANASDVHEALRHAVEALPEPQREVLLMRIVDAMSTAEIALALDIPDGTVKSRLSHALRALREHAALAPYFRD